MLEAAVAAEPSQAEPRRADYHFQHVGCSSVAKVALRQRFELVVVAGPRTATLEHAVFAVVVGLPPYHELAGHVGLGTVTARH